MIEESVTQSYYTILDVRMNATTEAIREAYIRAKNAFSNDSLATYSLFDKSESKRIIDEIEIAYNVLSDPDKRKLYDQAHGFIRSAQPVASPLPKLIPMDVDPLENVEEEVAEVRAFPGTSERIALAAAPIAAPAEASPSRTKTTVQPITIGPSPLRERDNEKNRVLAERLTALESIGGAFLRESREYKGVSVDELMEFTKLSRRYIQALEEDAVAKLPAPAYVRGFVIQIAKALQVNSTEAAAKYMVRYQSLRDPRGAK